MRKLGILEKLTNEFKKTDFDAVLVFGYDHIRYLIGGALPFLGSLPPDTVAVFWIRDAEPVLIAPAYLRDTFRSGGRIRNVQPYYPYPDCRAGEEPFRRAKTSLESVLTDIIEREGLDNGKIGLTERRIPFSTARRLRKKYENIRFTSCDQWIKDLRMRKTAAELELLAELAGKTDHGLAGAAHHVMVYAARPEKGLSEIIRVHCIERGLDMTGYESLAVGASGEHTTVPWPEAPFYGVGKGKQLMEGELVRMEIRTSLDGYWSDAARLLVMGEPDDAQQKAYDDIVILRNKALDVLKPGRSCSEVARELLEFCTERGIDLVKPHGLGHGIGVMPVEAPFIDPSDPTELQSGMVIVLTPTVKGPEGELVRSYDTVIMEEQGPRLVGWYKDWNTPYKAVKSYQHGGG